MAQRFLLRGSVANDKTGTPARLGAEIINENFTEVYEAIDVINRIDRVNVSTGFSAIVSQDITIYAGWEWTINNVDLTNPADVVIADIPLCDTEKSRIDYIVPNETNGFTLISGEETTGSATAPNLPNNGIYVTFFTVTDSEVQTPEPPILGDNFIPKLPVTVNQQLLAYVKEDGTIGRLLPQAYPNLDETAFVKGVTGPIQGQINASATLATDQTFSGLKTFLNGKFGFRNALNTFTSFFLNNNTAARTYTFQDKTGTVAHVDDIIVKTYKTYFINTATGNDATGVYEDASKPFANIDYITALPSYAGGIIFLQNAGTFAINNTLPSFNVTFKSDVAAEIVTSAMTTTFIAAPYGKNVFFDMPFGKVTNNKNGSAGTSIYNCSVVINLKELYHFSASPFISDIALLDIVKLNILSVGNGAFISTPTSVITTRVREIFINQIVCLQTNSRLIDSAEGKLKISIGLISGSGSFLFHSARWDVGDITTTGTCSAYGYVQGSGYSHLHFRNSIITSAGGISLGEFGLNSGLLVTGNINSCPSISEVVAGSANSGIKKFLNFSANLGTGTFSVDYNSTIFENCSIKSTNSPITIVGGASTAVILEIKNSVFEVVNAVPLVTGGAGGNNTLKIAGLSTNATMLSDQNGTGVTVTQFTNY